LAEHSAQERTEQATPKRLRDAREKGQIARSRDLNTMILMLAASGGLLALGETMVGGMVGLMQRGLSLQRADLFDTAMLGIFLGTALQDALLLFAPFLALLFVVALLAPLSLGGWAFSPKALVFKWSRLDVVKGFGRIFSRRGVVESLKAFAKFAVVATASVLLLYHWADQLFVLGDEPLHQALAHMAHLVGWSFVAISAVLVLIAAVDVPFQLAEHARKLKMTRQEVKDEHKETDGNPEVKSRIRTLQRQIAQQRMMEDVPTADVVVTNPTHYAVALRYDQEDTSAPRVVAKGADIIAGQIRKVAQAHDVTIVAAPPLTRALYFNTEIGQEIPAGLYLAVAQLLAYVYQLKSVQASGMNEPEPPQDLPVPDELLQRDH
jgi:flagellar biosynthetic protein FlhB